MTRALGVIAVGIPAGLALFAAVFWVWMRYSGADTLVSI